MNTRHGGRRARPKKSEGARRIGRHGHSGNEQAKTSDATTAGSPALSIGDRQGESTHLHNLRQRRPCTTKGATRTKNKKIGDTVAAPPPRPRPDHHPPPPRRKRTPSRRARSRTIRGRDVTKDKKKIRLVVNIAPTTEGTASPTDRRTTSLSQNAITTRSGQGGYRSGSARKLWLSSRSTTSAPNEVVGIGTRQRDIRTCG